MPSRGARKPDSALAVKYYHPSDSLTISSFNLQRIFNFLSKATMSYIPVSKDSHFSIKNIPFGIFSSSSDSTPRPATIIGEYVLDLSVLAKRGAFKGISGFDESTLQQVFHFWKLI